MTIAEQLHAEGRAEGLAEGHAEARIATLRRLLLLKFHALDATCEARLHAASPEAIDRYLDRVLFASSLDDVFED